MDDLFDSLLDMLVQECTINAREVIEARNEPKPTFIQIAKRAADKTKEIAALCQSYGKIDMVLDAKAAENALAVVIKAANSAGTPFADLDEHLRAFVSQLKELQLAGRVPAGPPPPPPLPAAKAKAPQSPRAAEKPPASALATAPASASALASPTVSSASPASAKAPTPPASLSATASLPPTRSISPRISEAPARPSPQNVYAAQSPIATMARNKSPRPEKSAAEQTVSKLDLQTTKSPTASVNATGLSTSPSTAPVSAASVSNISPRWTAAPGYATLRPKSPRGGAEGAPAGGSFLAGRGGTASPRGEAAAAAAAGGGGSATAGRPGAVSPRGETGGSFLAGRGGAQQAQVSKPAPPSAPAPSPATALVVPKESSAKSLAVPASSSEPALARSHSPVPTLSRKEVQEALKQAQSSYSLLFGELNEQPSSTNAPPVSAPAATRPVELPDFAALLNAEQKPDAAYSAQQDNLEPKKMPHAIDKDSYENTRSLIKNLWGKAKQPAATAKK